MPGTGETEVTEAYCQHWRSSQMPEGNRQCMSITAQDDRCRERRGPMLAQVSQGGPLWASVLMAQ